MFVHHVFFWLKNSLSQEDVLKFENGVKSLAGVEAIKIIEIGKPAATNRPVIDRSYSYSLLLVFDSQADHDLYQPHPVHKKFVDDCSSLWSKVVIYDSESVK
jgi:Stress responsive A/B Barrel Domain